MGVVRVARPGLMGMGQSGAFGICFCSGHGCRDSIGARWRSCWSSSATAVVAYVFCDPGAPLWCCHHVGGLPNHWLQLSALASTGAGDAEPLVIGRWALYASDGTPIASGTMLGRGCLGPGASASMLSGYWGLRSPTIGVVQCVIGAFPKALGGTPLRRHLLRPRSIIGRRSTECLLGC